MSADAMHQLGVMISFPDEEVVVRSLHGYLEDGAPSGLRVTAPMYRTRGIGGHIAVRIDEFPLTMQPADFLPVDTLPGNEILTRQLDRHPDLSWSPGPGSLRRKFRDRPGKEICVVEAPSGLRDLASDVVLVRKNGHSWLEPREDRVLEPEPRTTQTYGSLHLAGFETTYSLSCV